MRALNLIASPGNPLAARVCGGGLPCYVTDAFSLHPDVLHRSALAHNSTSVLRVGVPGQCSQTVAGLQSGRKYVLSAWTRLAQRPQDGSAVAAVGLRLSFAGQVGSSAAVSRDINRRP